MISSRTARGEARKERARTETLPTTNYATKFQNFGNALMATNLIDLGHTRAPSHDDLPGLFADLTQLVGEPFRFARVSYGDELTLHFGDLEQARSVKLKDKRYGAYILGVAGRLGF